MKMIPSQHICPVCQYDWVTAERLHQHSQGDECQVNLSIRSRMILSADISLDPITGFEHLLDAAGLEQWGSDLDPHNTYAPIWIKRICLLRSLGQHRVWLLREIARKPQMQVAISRTPHIDKLISSMLSTHLPHAHREK